MGFCICYRDIEHEHINKLINYKTFYTIYLKQINENK